MIRVQVCGRSCVTPKKRCRKPPERGFCTLDQFQVKLPLEETSAQAEATSGDTSFDPATFAPPIPAAPEREPGEPEHGWFGVRPRRRNRTARAA